MKKIFAMLLALTAVIFTATGASAGTKVPTTTIYSSGLCLTASGGSAYLSQCDPDSAAQQWVFTHTGRFRLRRTAYYIVATPTGLFLGSWAKAAQWVAVNHQLATEGLWLTWCPPVQPGVLPAPYLAADGSPSCQTWYVFTKV
jgi:hypothetical protein